MIGRQQWIFVTLALLVLLAAIILIPVSIARPGIQRGCNGPNTVCESSATVQKFGVPMPWLTRQSETSLKIIYKARWNKLSVDVATWLLISTLTIIGMREHIRRGSKS